jgi:imidazolonepropionase-like amidohydrolase
VTRTYVANVTLFDGRDVEASRGVLIEDGRIAWVGEHGRAPSQARDAEVVDGAGMTLTPGLIDAHVHLSFEGTADMAAESKGLTDEVVRANVARNLERHLDAGVTTVRDLGAPSTLVCELARSADGELPGIVPAGRALTITGGHGRGMFAAEVQGVDEVRAHVRAQVAAGARAIKVIATGGVVTPGIGVDFTAFSQEELDAAVAEAHAAGVPVAAHAHGEEGTLRSVRAGVDSVEHGSQIDGETLQRMLARGTFHVATIAPGRVILDRADEAPDYALAKSREIAPAREASFRRTVAAGVRHAAGTDAGTPYNAHGELPRELAYMVEWGMTPPEAMRAATSGGAELLRLPDVGVVEPERVADLVLYAGNPCEDISVTASPVGVWKRGVRVR